MVVYKIWEDVENALDDIENAESYYVGGTLCIDNVVGHIGMGLNTNGQGFVYGGSTKNDKIYLPSHITTKVKEIYNKYKTGSVE